MTASSLREKAVFELRKFCFLAIYLWICFGAIVFLKAAILQAEGVAYLPLGFAAIKAVVAAKFVLIGEMLDAKRSHRTGERLLVSILRRTFLLLILLGVMTVIEEATIAMIHGRSLAHAFDSLVGNTVWEMAATVVLMLLILLPYVGFRSLSEALGEDVLHRLLVEPRHDAPR
jgi:hypothetical protein